MSIYTLVGETSVGEVKKTEEVSMKRDLMTKVTSFKAHEDSVNMIQPVQVKDSKYFITCSDDKTLKLWDFHSLEVV